MKELITPSIKALIFDLDGTFADTMPTHYKACQIACNELGFDFPEDFFYEMAGTPTHEVFEILVKKLGLDIDHQSLADKKENLFLSLIHEVTPLQPVEEIAQQYKGVLPMAIGTGGIAKSVSLTLEAINYTGFFQTIVTSEDVSFPKPDPETFLTCARLLNVAPENCLVFEDGDLGIEAALKGGMKICDVRKYL